MATRGGKRDGAGRPIGARSKVGQDVRAAAQVFTRSAIATLGSVMRDKTQPAAARVAAANAILDRAHGKPKQAMEHSGPNGGPIRHVDLGNLSDEQLDTLESIFGPLASADGDDAGDPEGEGAPEG